MSVLYSMPMKEFVFVTSGDWQIRIDRIWGIVIEMRVGGKNNTWDCWNLETIGM